MNESTNPAADEIPNEWNFWSPFVLAFSGYCIFAFIWGTSFASGSRLSTFGYAVGFAMSQFSGLFAALGPGSYLKRLAVTQACHVAFWLALYGGFAVSGGTPRGGSFVSGFLSIAVAVSVAPQIVFGFLRLAAGWRLHKAKMERGPAYDLKDMFSLTLYVSVALAPLSTLLSSSVNREPEVVMALFSIFMGLLMATLIYGVPTVAATFKSNVEFHGCGVQLIIIAAISFLVSIPLLSFGAGKIVVPMLLLLCGGSLLTWLPLAVMREKGFVLTNGEEEHEGESID